MAGRPKLRQDQVRSRHVSIRVTRDEYRELGKLAAHFNLSIPEAVRQLITGAAYTLSRTAPESPAPPTRARPGGPKGARTRASSPPEEASQDTG